MNCFNCGAPITDEHKTCPSCGKAIQIVPDYNVFDDDDISVLMEAAPATTPSNTTSNKASSQKTQAQKKENAERIRARKEKERQKKLERKKKIQMFLILVSVIAICGMLFCAFFVISDALEKRNANSFDYQVKQAEAALEANDFELAESYYYRALELVKKDSDDALDIRFVLADLYKEHNMLDKMLSTYHEIINIHGQNYTAYKALFQHYNSNNDVEAILELRGTVTSNRIMALFQEYAVENPKIYLKGGTYKGTIEVMVSANMNYEIYYTIDGTDPTKNGILYTGTIKIDQTGMVTLKVSAKNEKGVFSNIVQETYYLDYEAPAAPVVLPDGGTFHEITYITVVVPSGCTAYYSWDGIDPTIDSLTKFEYTEPIIVPSGENVLRIIIYDDKTGLASETYRKIFVCSVEGIKVPIIIIPEETETETETEAETESGSEFETEIDVIQ